MKVVVIKAPKIDNASDNITKFLNSIRCEDSKTITETDIQNSIAFKKTQAAINILDTLTALEYVDTENPNTVSEDLFNRYVAMGNIIDAFFANLIQDYMDAHETENDVCNECSEYAPCGKCSLDCDIECGECEHCAECDDESFEDDNSCLDCSFCADCEANACAEDAFKLVEIFKPAFNIDDVSENDKEITITMTGKEYLEIKEILDQYELDEEETTC